jgi:hypothetical protein
MARQECAKTLQTAESILNVPFEFVGFLVELSFDFIG